MNIDRSVTHSILAIMLSVSAGCSVTGEDATSASTEPLTGDDSSGIGLVLRPAAHAELDAFGCVAADHGVFAGRYSSIQVFADVASLGRHHRRTRARVFGQLSVGLPDLMSGAYIEWDVAWLGDDDSMLLYGSALTPLGDTVVARLPLPRGTGVYAATINTTNMTTGAITNDAVSCTVR